MISSTTILLAFLLVVMGRYFLIPLLREWPGDMPETRRLRRLKDGDEFWRLLVKVTNTIPSMVNIPKQDRIRAQRAETLRLTVCGVTQCVKCSYLHTRTALEKGIKETRVREILAGRFEGVQAEDLAAVRFAQHFAEQGGDTSAEAMEAVLKTYGEDEVRQMSAHLIKIYFSTLCCNTVHYYERGRLDERERLRLYLAYILARPVEWFITRDARQRELKRSMMEGNQRWYDT
jgi:AhpD family alkylhydroperoxidase